MRRLRRVLSAPIRFWRYIAAHPGGSYEQRFNAMTPAEQEQERARSLKRSGLFLAFVNMRPSKRKP
jgi:hypothetical protein